MVWAKLSNRSAKAFHACDLPRSRPWLILGISTNCHEIHTRRKRTGARGDWKSAPSPAGLESPERNGNGPATLRGLKARLQEATSNDKQAGLRVLAIVAHCDDEAIGPGGTLATLAAMREAQVAVAILAADNPVRRAESLTACRRMGIPEDRLFLLQFPDGRLLQEMDSVRQVLREIDDALQPDLVITHKPDMHPDHCLLFALVRQVFSRNGVSILHFRIPQPANTPWNPAVYVRIAERAAQLKLRGLFEAYPTENWKDYFDPVIAEAAMTEAGYAAGSRFAESFETAQLWLAPCVCGCGWLVLAGAHTKSEGAPVAVGIPRRIVLEPCPCGCGSVAVGHRT